MGIKTRFNPMGGRSGDKFPELDLWLYNTNGKYFDLMGYINTTGSILYTTSLFNIELAKTGMVASVYSINTPYIQVGSQVWYNNSYYSKNYTSDDYLYDNQFSVIHTSSGSNYYVNFVGNQSAD